MIIKTRLLLLFIIITSTLFACGKGSNTDNVNNLDNPNSLVSQVTGQIKADTFLSGVKISVGNKSTQSDINGFYQIKEIPVGDGRLVFTFEKPGFGVYQRTIMVEADQSYAVDARLLRYQFEETVDLTGDKELIVSDPSDVTKPVLVKLMLPQGSVINASNISVSIARGDPTTEAGKAVFPGDFMAANSVDDIADTPLESIAFTEITMTDSDGKDITTLEKPATLTVRLPDDFQTNGARAETYIPNDAEKGTIEWWSYDETKAIWIREDADPSTDIIDDATVIMDENGVLYAEAKVTHFSWWNADKPVIEHACLCVTVVDENGDPVVGAQVVADGVSYDGRSTPVLTDDQGKACLTVKRSLNANNREKVKISVQYGGVAFVYDVTDVKEGNVTSNEIFTPLLSGSTIRVNSGQCVDLKNDLELAFKGTIKGSVKQEWDNAAAVGFILYTNFGTQAVTNTSGAYSIKVPLSQPITLFAPEISSQTVMVTNPTPVIVDFVIPNNAPVIESITRSVQGVVSNDAIVIFTANVTDKENDDFTYSWTLTSGTGLLTGVDKKILNWQAPASGAGTDTIRLTVTDARGAVSASQVDVVWGQSSVGGTVFTLLLKDRVTEQAAPGVTVVMYDSDNKTFSPSNVKVSDASGLIDFGDIGKTRVTFSIFSENQIDNENLEVSVTERSINAYVDVQVVKDAVYYIESDKKALNNSCTLIEIAKVQLENVPMNVSFDVYPGFITQGMVQNSGTISMCDYEYNNAIAKTGKVSFLIGAHKYNAETSIDEYIAYGMLLDVTQDQTTVNTVSLDKTPGTVRWKNVPDNQFDTVRLSGNYLNIEYVWPESKIKQFTQNVNGVLKVPRTFPFDSFDISADNILSNATPNLNTLIHSYSVSKHYTQLADTITLDSPTETYSKLDFDTITGDVSWELSDTFEDDFQFITLTSTSTGSISTKTNWIVYLSPAVTNWTVMNLPTMASSWIDLTDFTNSFDGISATSINIESLDGADQVWATLVTTDDSKMVFDNIVKVRVKKQFKIPAGVDMAFKTVAESPLKGQNTKKNRASKIEPAKMLQGFRRIRR